MPYAKDGVISQDLLGDGIEISESEYQLALSEMLDGKEVKIIDGSLVLVDPPDPHKMELPPPEGPWEAM